MAFDPKPSTWFGAGYSQDDTNHLISLNTNSAASNKTLPDVTDATSDATTGDVRAVCYALCETMFNAQEAQEEVDLPTKMRMTRKMFGDTSGNPIRSYTFTFNLTGSLAMASE